MTLTGSNYEEITKSFNWEIPEKFNMGVDVCDKWADQDPQRLAIIYVDPVGGDREYTFGALKALSNRIANLLVGFGLKKGDRVGVLLPQTPETAAAHIAVHKAGAISIPLSKLFGTQALEFRVGNSEAKFLITDDEGALKIADIQESLPDLEKVFSIDGTSPGAMSLYAKIEDKSETFEPVDTHADDPALIIYTSGTTGHPKGALHAHRVLLGHLPGVEISHDLFPQPGDRIWTPADWAWIGGLLDVLYPALHHGTPVVARRFEKFSGEEAFQLIQDYGIRNTFLPPTALKMMRSVEDADKRWNLNLRTLASGGETLGSELIEWGRQLFGVTLNEFYGQTECNMIVSSCAAIMKERPGIMGRAVPGHQIAIVSDDGEVLSDGKFGNIAVKSPDPVMFLEYWKNPDATQEKFIGDWLLTGDTGIRDAQGWIQFVGRNDDVITSSGYRIGPGEIEDCLISHPAVKMAGVIGKPDSQRTEIVKAYIQLNDNFVASIELGEDIQSWVKTKLAAYEYPREIAFVEALPLTTTGKIIRKDLRAIAHAE